MTARTHKTLWARALLVVGVLSFAVGLYVVRAEEPGETFGRSYSYHGFNLRVDSEASYNGVAWPSGTWDLKNLKPWKDKFWDFGDIKPGDRGENTISLHADKDAWVCLEFINLKEKENGENEPESHEDLGPPNEGELAKWMHFFAWHDDGDNIFEVGEEPIFGPASAEDALDNQVYPLYDYANGPALPSGQTKYFGIYWCAGEMTVDVPTATITCDGEPMGNEAQTDSMSVDLQLFALPKKDFPKFKCSKIVLPPPGEVCEVGKVEIKIDNNSTVTSTTTSSSNTGGNTAGSGGTVVTGNASSTSSTTNTVNTTNIINNVLDLIRRR